MAEFQSTLGRFDDAEASVERGMARAQGTTYYRGHLYEMRGVVAERRAKTLRAQGKLDEAKRAEAAAMSAFEKSMQIQEKVLDDLLKDDAGPAKN
jgi:hypothetical protein